MYENIFINVSKIIFVIRKSYSSYDLLKSVFFSIASQNLHNHQGRLRFSSFGSRIYFTVIKDFDPLPDIFVDGYIIVFKFFFPYMQRVVLRLKNI